MTRILYSIGIWFACTGLALQAKGVVPASSQPEPAPAPNKTTKNSTDALADLTSDKNNKSKVKATASTTSPDKAKTTATSSDKAKSSVAKTSEKSAPSTFSSRPVSTNSVASSRSHSSDSDRVEGGRLARLTAYWSGEGDYYTGRGMSSTGIHLHSGHCAVDPRIIPYGSVVTIDGVGKYLAVDTGSAVISREAARETGHSPEERAALVIDIYFESRADGERFSAGRARFAKISWASPTAVSANTASAQETSSSLTE